MRLAKVVGQVVATVKEDGLSSFKLLMLQDATGATQARTSGPVYVAIDLVGAGEGELVLVVSGSGARICADAVAARHAGNGVCRGRHADISFRVRTGPAGRSRRRPP